MLVFLIIATIIVLVSTLISQFVFKRKLNIEEKKLYPFSKDRNKLFSFVEILIFIVFTITCVVYMQNPDSSHFSSTFIPKLPLIFLFAIYIIRGVELWIFNRKERSYYYQYLVAAAFLTMFIAANFLE